MPLIRRLAFALCNFIVVWGLSFPATASAQQADITGAWSWQVGTQLGPIASTLFIRPDGGYVLAVRLADGTMMRQWGQYRATQIAQYAFRLQTQIAGYLPHQSCVAIAGFGQRCSAVPPPPPLTTVLTLTSPTTAMSDGSVLQRDLSGGLLNVPVPETAVIAGRTPTQPNIAQPVAPSLTPYRTPNGPGNQMANQFHQNNENFSQGYMRGCMKDYYGNWVNCRQ